SGVPQPWLGRCWNRPNESWSLWGPWSPRLRSEDSWIAAATAMTRPRCGMPRPAPTETMMAALVSCSLSYQAASSGVGGVEAGGAGGGAAGQPEQPADAEHGNADDGGHEQVGGPAGHGVPPVVRVVAMVPGMAVARFMVVLSRRVLVPGGDPGVVWVRL